MPIFLPKFLELRCLKSLGHISRLLGTYSVLNREAPIFEACLRGDLEGLQVMLSSGSVSPFVTNEEGWSLLHVRQFRSFQIR